MCACFLVMTWSQDFSLVVGKWLNTIRQRTLRKAKNEKIKWIRVKQNPERQWDQCPPPPSPIIHPHFPSISMWNRKKNDKCTKLKGKIIINVTLIWFERTCKTIPFNSVLEFSILSDFKMRNVIIWHWFIKNLVGTWRRNEFCPILAPHYSKPCPRPTPIF